MKKLFTISLCLVIALTACIPTFGQPTQEVDANASVQTAIAGTKSVENAVGTSVALTAAANQPPPAATTEPPPAATTEPPPTEDPSPTGAAKANANCRSGPGSNFDLVVLLKPGDGGKIIGKYTPFDPDWYKLELPDGKQCWVANDSLNISGDVAGITELSSPPTPTPRPAFAGTWTIWWRGSNFAGGGWANNITMTCTESGLNVTCNLTSWDQNFLVKGTLSEDRMYMNGQLTSNAVPWSWIVRWVKIGENAFGGSWYWATDNTFDGDWCGARPGGSKPDPCKR